MKEKAVENFMQKGYSCSESVVKAAADKGLVNQNLVQLATPFSGGMGIGCLCGAIAGMQLVIGALKGRQDSSQSAIEARACAKLAVEKFKELHKFTCCKALTAGLEMGSAERKQNCKKLVSSCAQILEEITEKELV